MPIFSIITPCFNAKNYIRNCVESVQYACKDIDYEHIITDGGSTDETLDILNALIKANPHLRIYSERDRGMYDALNKGIATAKGSIIGHLNTDEQYNAEGLRLAIQKLTAPTRSSKASELQAVFSPTIMLNSQYEFIQIFNQVVVPRPIDTLWSMPVQSCSLLYKKSVWERYPYNVKYRLVADHEWFKKQMFMGLKIEVVKKPIGIFVWRPNNLSNSTGKTNPEDALEGLDRKSFKLRIAKYIYRLRKCLSGGYISRPVSYGYFNEGILFRKVIESPQLKVKPSELK